MRCHDMPRNRTLLTAINLAHVLEATLTLDGLLFKSKQMLIVEIKRYKSHDNLRKDYGHWLPFYIDRFC